MNEDHPIVVRHFPAGNLTVDEAANDFAATYFDKPREVENWNRIDGVWYFNLKNGMATYAIKLNGLFYDIIRVRKA